jgi:solute carrier family 25 phosphate transporter 23/24/25/41
MAAGQGQRTANPEQRRSKLRSQSVAFASISLSLPPPRTPRCTGSTAGAAAPGNVVFELGAAKPVLRPTALQLAQRRPVALLAMVPRALVLFGAGAVSGALAKTITAPLDRVKILLQVKGGLETGAVGIAAREGSLIRSLIAVGKQEGLSGYWKGNLPQVLRVVPYSAAQLYSYEVFKQRFVDEDGKLTVPRRLAAGAAAGMTATIVSPAPPRRAARPRRVMCAVCGPMPLPAPTRCPPPHLRLSPFAPRQHTPQLTHPLDTLRLRMAVDPGCKTLLGAIRVLAREGSGPAFYRGLGASMAGIAPYMALELACYDLLPRELPSFARGFTSALIATVSCYPLDTVRRRIQLQAARAVPWRVAVAGILAEEGVVGMYRGFVPNALKNLPNKGVKLSVFDHAKTMLALGETAYAEECAAAGCPVVATTKA